MSHNYLVPKSQGLEGNTCSVPEAECGSSRMVKRKVSVGCFLLLCFVSSSSNSRHRMWGVRGGTFHQFPYYHTKGKWYPWQSYVKKTTSPLPSLLLFFVKQQLMSILNGRTALYLWQLPHCHLRATNEMVE